MPEEEKKTFEVELDDGTTVEAVSKAELDAILKEKQELEAKLKAEQDKEKNFKNVRSKAEEAEERARILEERLGAVENKFKQTEELTKKQQEERIESDLTEAVGDDEDLKKRVKFEYDQFSGTSLSHEEKLNRALKLSREDDAPSPIAKAASVQGRGFIKRKDTDFGDTDKGKEVANLLGIQIDKPNK